MTGMFVTPAGKRGPPANCWNGKIDWLCLHCLKNMAGIKPLCLNDLFVALVLYTTILTMKKKTVTIRTSNSVSEIPFCFYPQKNHKKIIQLP